MMTRTLLLLMLVLTLNSCNKDNKQDDSPDEPNGELNQFVGYWTSDNKNSGDLLLWSDHTYTAPSPNTGGSWNVGEWYYDSTTSYLTLTGYSAKTYIITHISAHSMSGINIKNQETVSFEREDHKAVYFAIFGNWVTDDGMYLNIGYHVLRGTKVPDKTGYVDITSCNKKLNLSWIESENCFSYTADYEDNKHYWHPISSCQGTLILDNWFSPNKQTLTLTGMLEGIYHRETSE